MTFWSVLRSMVLTCVRRSARARFLADFISDSVAWNGIFWDIWVDHCNLIVQMILPVISQCKWDWEHIRGTLNPWNVRFAKPFQWNLAWQLLHSYNILEDSKSLGFRLYSYRHDKANKWKRPRVAPPASQWGYKRHTDRHTDTQTYGLSRLVTHTDVHTLCATCTRMRAPLAPPIFHTYEKYLWT